MFKFLFAFVIISFDTKAQILTGIASYDHEIFNENDSVYTRTKTSTLYFKGNLFYQTIGYDKKYDVSKPGINSNGEQQNLNAEQAAVLKNHYKNTIFAPKLFDYEKKLIFSKEELFDQSFIIVDSLYPREKFILTKDTATISSIFCQKAILSDSTFLNEYWFAPSIPTIAGPDNLGGFPGLLVLFYNKKTKRRIKLISLEYPSKKVFKRPYTNSKYYTRLQAEDYMKTLRSKYLKNIR